MVKTFAGVAVPIPTLTAKAPVPPSTRALLSLTCACEPIAVELKRLGEMLSGPAEKPRAVLYLPVRVYRSAAAPLAVLPTPVVFWTSALAPLAVLTSPEVLNKSALLPIAVFKLPKVLEESAPWPIAVFAPFTFLDESAPRPTAVFPVLVVVEFPANPRNTFWFENEPNANGTPARSKLVAALIAPFTSSFAPGFVVPMPTFPAVLWKIIEFPSLVALSQSGIKFLVPGPLRACLEPSSRVGTLPFALVSCETAQSPADKKAKARTAIRVFMGNSPAYRIVRIVRHEKDHRRDYWERGTEASWQPPVSCVQAQGTMVAKS